MPRILILNDLSYIVTRKAILNRPIRKYVLLSISKWKKHQNFQYN